MADQQKDSGGGSKKDSARDRSPSPNPFLSYLSSSPSKSDNGNGGSATPSPRSPRFQTEFFQNGGARIPMNGANISQAMLTTGTQPWFSTSSHGIYLDFGQE